MTFVQKNWAYLIQTVGNEVCSDWCTDCNDVMYDKLEWIIFIVK